MITFKRFEFVGYEEVLNFTRNPLNRPVLIDGAHVGKLKRAYADGSFVNPIMVNTLTNNIIDGQNRVAAFISCIDKRLIPRDSKIAVTFVEIPTSEELEKIIQINTTSKSWTIADYINCYIKAGNQYYLFLEDWCMSHPLCHDKKPKYRYGSAIIKGKNCSTDLKLGNLIFTEEELNNAETIYKEIETILQILMVDKVGPSLEGLAKAWHEYRKFIITQDWQTELEDNYYLEMPKNNAADWKILITRLFNNLQK